VAVAVLDRNRQPRTFVGGAGSRLARLLGASPSAVDDAAPGVSPPASEERPGAGPATAPPEGDIDTGSGE
jgi:hypothetical protein